MSFQVTTVWWSFAHRSSVSGTRYWPWMRLPVTNRLQLCTALEIIMPITRHWQVSIPGLTRANQHLWILSTSWQQPFSGAGRKRKRLSCGFTTAREFDRQYILAISRTWTMQGIPVNRVVKSGDGHHLWKKYTQNCVKRLVSTRPVLDVLPILWTIPWTFSFILTMKPRGVVWNSDPSLAPNVGLGRQQQHCHEDAWEGAGWVVHWKQFAKNLLLHFNPSVCWSEQLFFCPKWRLHTLNSWVVLHLFCCRCQPGWILTLHIPNVSKSSIDLIDQSLTARDFIHKLGATVIKSTCLLLWLTFS